MNHDTLSVVAGTVLVSVQVVIGLTIFYWPVIRERRHRTIIRRNCEPVRLKPVRRCTAKGDA